MAGRKISEQEAARIKAAIYQHILDHPGVYRYQLADACLSAPGDALCYQLRALLREGRIRQDEEGGRGPLARLYPAEAKEEPVAAHAAEENASLPHPPSPAGGEFNALR